MTNIESVCEKIFRLAKTVQCEVTAEITKTALTRFADSVISQNVDASAENFSVRLLDNGRTAKINFNQSDDASLKRAVTLGMAILKQQKKDPGLQPLPKPCPIPEGASLYFKETGDLSPLYRAQRAVELAKACKKSSQTAYGTFENGTSQFTVANSLGLFARHRETSALYNVTVRDKDGFGWAQYPAFDVNTIPFDSLNASVRAKAAASRSPRELKPGRYPVILEPQAASDLLSYLAIYGFGGQLYNEGRSFICGNLGKQMLSPLLSIEDNASGAAPGMPFDYEGQPRKKVNLVKQGVIISPVHDRKTAKAAKTVSTGHALPQPSYMGPLPLNLAVTPGRGTLEELIKSTEYGILVTQFHYTNMLKAKTVEMTGMTRNGTFLVKDGKIAFPVKNLRFTQNMVEAFSGVEAVSGEAFLRLGWGGMSCPAFRLKNFNFSSSTQF